MTAPEIKLFAPLFSKNAQPNSLFAPLSGKNAPLCRKTFW
jgi:hypothetical protein